MHNDKKAPRKTRGAFSLFRTNVLALPRALIALLAFHLSGDKSTLNVVVFEAFSKKTALALKKSEGLYAVRFFIHAGGA